MAAGKLPVREYLGACEMLLHETDLAIADLEAMSKQPRVELRHIVDFSEVFAYAFPNKTLKPMMIFGDENPRNVELLQRDALDNLFFRAASGAIILPPHAAEMQRQIAKLRMGFFKDLVNALLAAQLDIERTVTIPEVRDLIARIQSGAELSEEQLGEALKTLERYATNVVLLHRLGTDPPFERMMRLARERRIVTLDGRLLDVKPHRPTWDRWFDRLLHDRLLATPAGDEERRAEIIVTSDSDAMAIGLLHALNHQAASSVRFLFITRSTHMHHIFDEELKAGLWKEDIFRHPRSFNSLFLRHHMRPSEGTQLTPEQVQQHADELQNRKASFDLFVSGTRPRLNAGEALENDPTFVFQIKKIREEWELSGVLASAGGDAPSVDDRRRKVVDVVELLTSRDTFRNLLNRRLDQLLEGVEGRQAFLGFYAQTESDRTELETAIRAELGEDDQAILTTRRYWVPHVLEFMSPELKDWAKSIEQQNDIRWTAITEFLRQTFSAEAEYERLLAMAYLLASLRKWDFAERFCRKAIMLSGGPTLLIQHNEAHFFLAVCLRMQKENRFTEALHHLDTATSLRRLRLGVVRNSLDLKANDDPRYLIERANYIYKWNEAAGKTGVTKPPFPREKALQLWEEALRLAGDDTRLRAQIHNNICFYHCQARKPNVKKIRHHLAQLIAAGDPKRERWPPLIIDTLAMALLRIFEHTASAEDRRELQVAQKLLSKVQKSELLEVHQEAVSQHVTAIEKALSQSDTPVAAAPLLI
jgi:tetratricopeptide (TPR) repeat protein